MSSIATLSLTRVSNNLTTFALLESLQNNTRNLFTLQQQLSSGRQLTQPSDDPVAATQALGLTTLLERQEQILENIQAADSVLSLTDATIGEVSTLLNDAYTLAQSNIEDFTLPAERDAAVLILDDLIDRLVDLGNSTFKGNYVFGGRQTDAPPLNRQGDGVAFTGDTGDLEALVELAATKPFNLTADALFGTLSSRVQGSADLNPAVTGTTRLTDLDGANDLGIRLGTISINEVAGAGTFSVDLTGADTLSDVIDAINAASTTAGATFTASLGTNGLQITNGGGFTFSITDVGTATAASDLGIVQTTAATGPLVGSDLDPVLTPRTLLTALNNGAGITLTGGLRITQDLNTAVVDLSTATTIQDVINAINSATGVTVRATINDARTGLDVVNPISGTAMTIGENGGTAAASLGLRSLQGATALSELNSETGVRTIAGKTDIRILAKDGTTQIDVDLSSATTVQDVIDLINAAAGGAVTADLVTTGNGIRITDTTGGTTRDLEVQALNFSLAAADLGILKTVASPATALLGDDVNGVEVDGIFTALLDLRDAIAAGDRIGLNRAAGRLDTERDRANRVRGQVGARGAAMNTRLRRTEDAVLATRTLLSDLTDLDYTEAVTRFQQAQTALQANLLTGSRILQISLMDFLQ